MDSFCVLALNFSQNEKIYWFCFSSLLLSAINMGAFCLLCKPIAVGSTKLILTAFRLNSFWKRFPRNWMMDMVVMNITQKNANYPLTRNRLGWVLCFLLVVFCFSGCRNGQRLFPNLNLGSMARIPAPSTGTLRFPGSGNAPLNPPPTQINVNPSATAADGTIRSGVFFQPNPSPYTSGQTNPATGQPLNSIPGRRNPLSASALGGPGAGGVASSPNPAAVNSAAGVTFDPFRTGNNPHWANSTMAGGLAQQQPATGVPSLLGATAARTDASRPGWYAGNPSTTPVSNGSTGFFQAQPTAKTNQNLAMGNGGLMQRMSNSIKSFFTQQPANMGGFQTTAPVNNPNGFLPGQTYPVAPVQYYQQSVPNGAFGNGPFRGNVPNQFQRSPATGLSGQGGLVSAPQNHVLGENSSSLMAENQARMGVRQPGPGNQQTGSAYAGGGGQVGGNVYPAGRPMITAAANQNEGINSQWVPVTARR